MKTPTARAAEGIDQRRAIGEKKTAISFKHLAATGRRPPPGPMKPGIVVGIPVEAEVAHINSIVNSAGRRHGLAACRPRVEVVRFHFEMEAAATDEGDRLAKGGGDGGEELFLGMKGHGKLLPQVGIKRKAGGQSDHQRER